MPIPSALELYWPLLKLACEREEVRMKDAVQYFSDQFNLTDEERAEPVSSRSETKINNNTWWARRFLVRDRYVETSRPGHIKATEYGKKALASHTNENKIDYKSRKEPLISGNREKRSAPQTSPTENIDDNPEDSILTMHGKMEGFLVDEILTKVISLSPDSFERLIIRILLAMNYGGTKDSGRRLGRSSDDGVDGVIDQDVLGLDRVYVQAKRYKQDSAVGSGDIRNFSGSLGMHKVTKGLFVTTSSFTKNARETASKTDKHIVLIDGQKLAQLMIHHDVGCRKKQSLHIQELDEEFFEDI